MKAWVFFIFLLLSQHAFSDYAEAQGGFVTPINLSVLQPTGRWQLFFGNYGTGTGTQTLSVYNPDSPSSSASRYVSLIGTSGNYWVSDSPTPSFSNLSSPNLTYFDEKFGLSDNSQSPGIFNDTYNFSLVQPYGPNGSLWISGPAVFFRGRNSSNGTTDSAYVQGVFQSGADFVFLVPLSNSSFENGSSYNFVFILPYFGPGGNASTQFYLFSNLSQAVIPPPPPGGNAPPVPYRWNYSDGRLGIFTVPHALVQLVNPQGRTISDNADSGGTVFFSVLGGTYYLIISASGYSPIEATLRLPESKRIIVPILKQPQSNLTPIISLGSGRTILCIGSDCYEAAGGTVFPVDEIQCTGELCKYVGPDINEFMRKYNFLQAPSLTVHKQQGAGAAPNPLVNFSLLFAGMGNELSQALGAGSQRGQAAERAGVAAVVLVALVSSVAGFYLWTMRRPPPKFGHD